MAFTRKGTFTVTSNAGLLPSTQTDFPILVSLTDANLKTIGNGGFVANANGYDIRFFSDPDLTVAIPFELERYVDTTGEIIFWVKIASLALGGIFYCGFGDAALNTNASSTSTWDADFLGVYHLPDGTTLTALDSTSNANNGTPTNTPTAGLGQIDGAVSLAAVSTQYVALGSGINPPSITVSAWIKATSLAAYSAVFARVNASATSYFELFVKSNGKLAIYALGSSNVDYDGTGSHTLSTATWYYLTAVYDGVTGLKGYVNAALDDSNAAAFGLQTSPSPSRIGSDAQTSGREWNGLIDEVRVSDIARSADWITTEYNNQLDPTTFTSSSFSGITPPPPPPPPTPTRRSPPPLGAGVPNTRKPFLPEIPLGKDDWQRLRYFLSEVKYRVEALAQSINIPDQVNGLIATPTAGGFQLTWNPSNWATGYVIYRAADSIKFTDAVAIGYIPRAPRISFFDPVSVQFPADTKVIYWVLAQNGVTNG